MEGGEQQEDEPLQLELEDRELYLVKVPLTLGDAWKKVSESDVILGKISLGTEDKTGMRKGTMAITTDCLSADTEIPTEYNINIFPTGLSAKVFSQDGSGRMAIEGVVKHQGNVMPRRGGEYRKLCKKRLFNSMIKDRYVKAIEDLPKPSKKKLQMTIEPPVEHPDDENSEDESADEIKAATVGDKRVKMDIEQLKNLVFQHFEETEFWPLKELNKRCKQPEGYLKGILKEICVYHKSGTNKTCYELKPQYKTSK